MYEWIRELFPSFIHKMYVKATDEGNSSAIKFFGEMVAKDMEVDKPKPTIAPFMIVGVPQSKIDAMFAPDELRVVEEAEPL